MERGTLRVCGHKRGEVDWMVEAAKQSNGRIMLTQSNTTVAHTQCCVAMEAGTQDIVTDGKGSGSGSAVWKDITEVRLRSPCSSLRCLSAACTTPTHRVKSPPRYELDRKGFIVTADSALPF